MRVDLSCRTIMLENLYSKCGPVMIPQPWNLALKSLDEIRNTLGAIELRIYHVSHDAPSPP